MIKIQFHYVRAHCVAHVSGAGVRARLRLRGGLVLRPLALHGRLPGREVAALLPAEVIHHRRRRDSRTNTAIECSDK